MLHTDIEEYQCYIIEAKKVISRIYIYYKPLKSPCIIYLYHAKSKSGNSCPKFLLVVTQEIGKG